MVETSKIEADRWDRVLDAAAELADLIDSGGIEIDEYDRDHWAYLPIEAPEIPAVRDGAWLRTPIDAFILAELESKQLRPAPPASRETLIRRLCYDLTGLPPSTSQLQELLGPRVNVANPLDYHLQVRFVDYDVRATVDKMRRDGWPEQRR